MRAPCKICNRYLLNYGYREEDDMKKEEEKKKKDNIDYERLAEIMIDFMYRRGNYADIPRFEKEEKKEK
jgi:hypothetical protein